MGEGISNVIRSELTEALKVSMKAQEKRAVSTIRLILAALKDRDICARADGNADGVPEGEVLTLLQTMVKQRLESIRLYEEGGRLELAEQEREETEVIKRFMPRELDGDELDDAVQQALREIGAKDMKDMGKTMALLKQRYPGRIDFSKASGMVRQALIS